RRPAAPGAPAPRSPPRPRPWSRGRCRRRGPGGQHEIPGDRLHRSWSAPGDVAGNRGETPLCPRLWNPWPLRVQHFPKPTREVAWQDPGSRRAQKERTMRTLAVVLLAAPMLAAAAADVESRVLTHYVPQDTLEAAVRKEGWTEIPLEVMGGVRKGDVVRVWAGGSIHPPNGDQPAHNPNRPPAPA